MMVWPSLVVAQSHRLAPEGSDSFGFAVSADGNRIAIGAPESGEAYLYLYDAVSGWSLEEKLDGDSSEKFGHSVSLEGKRLLVGAPDGGVMNGGAAYLFSRSGTEWMQSEMLEAPTPGQGDAFGTSVALSGIYAFIGAPHHDTDDGAVYVFDGVGLGIGYLQKMKVSDQGGLFGSAISLTNEVAVVGAPRADEPRGQAAGKAYVFERTGGSMWIERAVLVAGDASSESEFGTSVDVDQHQLRATYTVFVGAPKAGPLGSGAAYLFGKVGGQWSQRARYSIPTGVSGDRTGQSVVVSDDNFLVGSPGRDQAAGMVVALTVDTLVYAWQEDAHHEAPTRQAMARFGKVIDIGDNYGVIGAPNEEKPDQSRGVAYIYSRPLILSRENPVLPAGMISVFPNPFRNSVTISLDGNYYEKPVVDVYDLMGRRITSLSMTSSLNGDVAFWEPGDNCVPQEFMEWPCAIGRNYGWSSSCVLGNGP